MSLLVNNYSKQLLQCTLFIMLSVSLGSTFQAQGASSTASSPLLRLAIGRFNSVALLDHVQCSMLIATTYMILYSNYLHNYTDATPTLGKLSVLKTAEGKKIKIIESVAPLWQSLRDQLEFDKSGSKLGLIKATHPNDPKACCRDMFQHWLNGNGVRPCSWRKLIELLDDCDFEGLTAEVQSVCR